MTIEEQMNLQKGKEIPKRLQTASNNSENEAIDNYILNKIKIGENLKQEQGREEKKKQKEIEQEELKKQIDIEVEKAVTKALKNLL